jgi:hypothetical protein
VLPFFLLLQTTRQSRPLPPAFTFIRTVGCHHHNSRDHNDLAAPEFHGQSAFASCFIYLTVTSLSLANALRIEDFHYPTPIYDSWVDLVLAIFERAKSIIQSQ